MAKKKVKVAFLFGKLALLLSSGKGIATAGKIL